jgi:hypothetical protein
MADSPLLSFWGKLRDHVMRGGTGGTSRRSSKAKRETLMSRFLTIAVQPVSRVNICEMAALVTAR